MNVTAHNECKKCGSTDLDLGYGIGIGPGIGVYAHCSDCGALAWYHPDTAANEAADEALLAVRSKRMDDLSMDGPEWMPMEDGNE